MYGCHVKRYTKNAVAFEQLFLVLRVFSVILMLNVLEATAMQAKGWYFRFVFL